MKPSKTWTHIFFMGLLVVLASSGCATAQTSWDYNYKKFEVNTKQHLYFKHKRPTH